jgi:hypothetical protein
MATARVVGCGAEEGGLVISLNLGHLFASKSGRQKVEKGPSAGRQFGRSANLHLTTYNDFLGFPCLASLFLAYLLSQGQLWQGFFAECALRWSACRLQKASWWVDFLR